MSKGRLVVAGATGRIGRMLARVWSEVPPKGFDPVFTGRRAGGPVNAAQVACRFTEPERFAALVADADVVLDLAGPTRAKGTDLHHQHLELFEALAALAPCPVVTMSSSAVYDPGVDWAEDAAVDPPSAYGRAKLAVEHAVARTPGAVALRLANVAGADALLGPPGTRRDIRLDRFTDGATPARNYLGPASLARVLADLGRLAAAENLPKVLNLTSRAPVRMGALLDAADLPWMAVPAPEDAVRELSLSAERMAQVVAVPEGDAASVVAEWRALA